MPDKPDKVEKKESPKKNSPRVRWDTSNLKSSYANVCNVTSTREEVVLNFGINQTWEQNNQEMLIELSNRLILSPFAAKRLALMLNNLITEIESRHGKLNIETAKPNFTASAPETKQ